MVEASMMRREGPRWGTVLLGLTIACSQGGGPGAGTGDVVPTGEVCECMTAQDCAAKLKPNQCQLVNCQQCSCVLESVAAGQLCDDGNATTTGDACDGHGNCVGIPASCGNGKCESAAGENCGNCGDDCGCGPGFICYQDECEPEPKCGNGKCEPGENCGWCPKDCKCKLGYGCDEGKCKPCKDYCTDTGKECGKFQGCDCGKCPEGQECDALGRCYEASVCGNAVCEAGEDCGNCVTDCGCPVGQVCQDGKCNDCKPLCESAGVQCGFYQGCECGSCGTCYKCSQNQCVPKCDCLCWQKECGTVDGCDCGQCGPGEECVGYKCLEGCDTLCEGVECGWSQDCFCNWCTGCDACHGSTCQPGEGLDNYDSEAFNDFPEAATDLGKTTDSDSDSYMEIQGTIDVGFDEDWYKVEVEDQFGYIMEVHVEMTGLAEDKDLDVGVCFKCKEGELVGVDPEPKDEVLEIDSLVKGARCFSAMNLWGQDELVELKDLTCSSASDASGTVYIFVRPFTGDDCGSGYTLKLHM